MKKNTTNNIMLTVIAVFLIIIAVLLVMLVRSSNNSGNATEPGAVETTEPAVIETTQPAVTDTQEPIYEEKVPETTGIPLDTKYVEISYPTELEDMVRIQYEDLSDGQQIIFITEFTGEELELFRFSISKSGTDGHQLGTLSDEAAGALLVCVQVQEYTDGSWDPEDYAKLNEMQSRVNDIIIQFYEDPRFVPANS